MTTLLLYVSTLLIGVCWTAAQWNAARKEFQQPALKRNWLIASILLFMVVVSFTLTAGGSGWLGDFSLFPPPFAGFFLFIWTTAIYVAYSRFGNALVKHTPMYALIAFHAFRFLAEMIIWNGYIEGLAPRQLTFQGYNYDIVTAATALPVAWWAMRYPRSKVVWAWNLMGFGFLLIIAFIALTSMPNALRLFMEEPTNMWVTRLPYTLLPGVLVTAAIAGHLVIWRKLRNNP